MNIDNNLNFFYLSIENSQLNKKNIYEIIIYYFKIFNYII